MAPLPRVGRPLPRAVHASTALEKWRHWILSPRGHGEEWARVFRAGSRNAGAIWLAIARAVRTAPVTAIRDRGEHGLVCEVVVPVTLNGRSAWVVTAWHYASVTSTPRLVTAYPRP